MSLPYDYARCQGTNDEGVRPIDGPIYLRKECLHCLRRTSPGRPEWQSWMQPHKGPGPCPERIGADVPETHFGDMAGGE